MSDNIRNLSEFELALLKAFESDVGELADTSSSDGSFTSDASEDITSDSSESDVSDVSDDDADLSDDDADELSEEVESSEGEVGEDDGDGTASSSDDTILLDGTSFSLDDIRQMREVAVWFSSLPPEALNAFQALLAGTHVLVERSQIEKLQAKSPVSSDDEEEPVDPVAHERLERLERELAEQRRIEAEQRQTAALAQINAGQERFAQAHPSLTESELQELRSVVASMQILPGIAAAKNGDISAAMEAALEQAYWATPKFRDAEMQRFLESHEERARENLKRRRKASALSGNGASTSRTPPTPTTREDKNAAIVGMIEAAMRGQEM